MLYHISYNLVTRFIWQNQGSCNIHNIMIKILGQNRGEECLISRLMSYMNLVDFAWFHTIWQE